MKNVEKYEKNIKKEKDYSRKEKNDKDIHLNVVGVPTANVNVNKTSQGDDDKQYHLYKISIDAKPKGKQKQQTQSSKPQPHTMHRRPDTDGSDSLSSDLDEPSYHSPQNNKSLPSPKHKKSSEICVSFPGEKNREIRIVGNMPYHEGKVVSGTNASKPFTAEKAEKGKPGEPTTTGKEVLFSNMDAVYGTSPEDSVNDLPYTDTKHPVQIYKVKGNDQHNLFKVPSGKIDLLSEWRRSPDDYNSRNSPQHSPRSSSLGSKNVDNLVQQGDPEYTQDEQKRTQRSLLSEINSTYHENYAQDIQSLNKHSRTPSNLESARPVKPVNEGRPGNLEHYTPSISKVQDHKTMPTSMANTGTDTGKSTASTEIQTYDLIDKLYPSKTGESYISPYLPSSSTTPYSHKTLNSESLPSGIEPPVNGTHANHPSLQSAQQSSSKSSAKKPLKIDKDIMTEIPTKANKERPSKLGSNILRRRFSNKSNNPSNESSKHKSIDTITSKLKSPLKSTIPKPIFKADSLKTHEDKDLSSSTVHPSSLTTYSGRSSKSNIDENDPNFNLSAQQPSLKEYTDGVEDYISTLPIDSIGSDCPSGKTGLGTRTVSLQTSNKDRATPGTSVAAEPIHIQGRQQPQWSPSSEKRQQEPSERPTWPHEDNNKSLQSPKIMAQPQRKPSSDSRQPEPNDVPTRAEEGRRKSVQSPDVMAQPQWKKSSDSRQPQPNDVPSRAEEGRRKSVQSPDVMAQPQWKKSSDSRQPEPNDVPTRAEESRRKSVQSPDVMAQPQWKKSSESRQPEPSDTTTLPKGDSAMATAARQQAYKESEKIPVDEKFNAVKIEGDKKSPSYYERLGQLLDKLSSQDGAKANKKSAQINTNQMDPSESGILLHTDSNRTRNPRKSTPTVETIKEEEFYPEEEFFGKGNLPYVNTDAIAFPGHISDQTPFAYDYRPTKESLSGGSNKRELSHRSLAENNGRRSGDYASANQQSDQNEYYKPKIVTQQSRTGRATKNSKSNDDVENNPYPPGLRKRNRKSEIVPEDSFKGEDKRKVSKVIQETSDNGTMFSPKEEIIYVGKLPDSTYNVFFSPNTPGPLEETEEETAKNIYKKKGKEKSNREKPLSPVKSEKLLNQGPKGILMFVNKKNCINKTPFDERPHYPAEYDNKHGKKSRHSKGRTRRPSDSSVTSYSEANEENVKASVAEVKVERSPSGTKIIHTYPCGCLRIITSDPEYELAGEEIISAMCTEGSQCEVIHPELQKADRVIPYYPEPTPKERSFQRDGFPEIELIADGIISRKPIKPKQPAPTMKGADFTGSIKIKSNRINGVCNLYLDDRLKRYLRMNLYKVGDYLEDDRIKRNTY